MATEHLHRCTRILAAKLANREVSTAQYRIGHEAVLELVDIPWEFTGDEEELLWREGYEQCMTDITEALALTWGVVLPPDPLRSKEKVDAGNGEQG